MLIIKSLQEQTNIMDEKTLNFIAKAQIIHGDFYSYDKAVYLGNKDFYQKPDSWFGFGVNDLSLRKCLETSVDIFKKLFWRHL
jgi:hypothetical protein